LFSDFSARFKDNSEKFVEVLQGITWPFVVFAISLPALALLLTNLRQILAVKKTIDDAPENLGKALEKLSEYERRIDEVGANFSNSLESSVSLLESRIESLREAASGTSSAGPAGDRPQSPKERVIAHVEDALTIFEPALERLNADKRRKPVSVTRGGGNRPELARRLGGARLYADNQDNNELLTEYLELAFKLHLGSRKKAPDPQQLQRLDELRAKINEQDLINA
jgi:hypothetical protein